MHWVSVGGDCNQEQVAGLKSIRVTLDRYVRIRLKGCGLACASQTWEHREFRTTIGEKLTTTYLIKRRLDDLEVALRAVPTQVIKLRNGVVR